MWKDKCVMARRLFRTAERGKRKVRKKKDSRFTM
jgi:hypothetical protein